MHRIGIRRPPTPGSPAPLPISADLPLDATDPLPPPTHAMLPRRPPFRLIIRPPSPALAVPTPSPPPTLFITPPLPPRLALTPGSRIATAPATSRSPTRTKSVANRGSTGTASIANRSPVRTASIAIHRTGPRTHFFTPPPAYPTVIHPSRPVGPGSRAVPPPSRRLRTPHAIPRLVPSPTHPRFPTARSDFTRRGPPRELTPTTALHTDFTAIIRTRPIPPGPPLTTLGSPDPTPFRPGAFRLTPGRHSIRPTP